MHTPSFLARLSPPVRILVFVAVALAAHFLVRTARDVVSRLVGAPAGGDRAAAEATLARRHPKFASITSLLASAFTFAVYFLALGLVLEELGVRLTAYLASASVVGLAIAFGSQGLVQDVVIGLTLLFSDAFDVGDVIEYAAGQAGRVERIGLRFTTVTNYLGQTVYLPNRTIGSVSRYRHGCIRLYVDIQVPEGTPDDAMVGVVTPILQGLRRQFGAIVLSEPEILGIHAAGPGEGGWRYLRAKLRLWPGPQAVVETALRQRLLAELRARQSGYADWMISVTNRVA
ncbi:MAG TPA: mechanosensitive ion channel domain-containing protein [Gemmatimonadota bacterium]|nr:mechanosensitive ion channel domain-containing protein [Gemmatimonadota bacterium]